VKLLFDQNLAPRLVDAVADLFPDSAHVRSLDLHKASDAGVWDYAKEHGFAIVSKDSDFHQRSFLHGAPPKVIWVRLGNCTTRDVEDLLRTRSEAIVSFGGDPEAAFLVLNRT
jgi:predicted nuclease of predicted toxin-antitoxin system